MSACKHDALPLVIRYCRDDAEVLALSISRSIASGYMTGDVACWDVAHGAAETILGPQKGAALAAAITAVVRAIRAERRREWSFLPATCCRVTRDEQDLVSLLQAARSSAASDVAAQAARLVDLPASGRLAAAALHAAAIMDEVAASIRLPTEGTVRYGRPHATLLQ
ncbi:MAG: hypothetical protein U1E62_26145 [Alsobacter sp.]